MQAASALRPSGLAARPTPARRACASKPRPTRPCIIVAATSDPSEGSGRPQAAAAAAAAGVIAAGVLLAHASPALAEDGSRGAAVITSPPTLEFPDQLAAPAAPQAPALRTSAQAAPHAGANDIVQTLRDLGESLRSRLNEAADSLKPATEPAGLQERARQGAERAGGAVKQGAERAGGAVKQAGQGAAGAVKQGAESAAGTVKQGAESAAGAVKQGAERAGAAANEGASSAVDAACQAKDCAAEQAAQAAQAAKEGAQGAASKAAGKAGEAAGGAVEGAKSLLQEGAGAVKGAAEEAAESVKEGARSLKEGAQSAAEQAGSALKSAPSKVSGEVQRLGREAIPDGTQPPATASEGTKRWARGSLGEGELQPNKEWLREQVPDSGRR